ncbi:polysaccharide lyase 8 family protein [Cetobacterium somerae]|uniref:polysaccharide lyase 8 family protein n=1 Tax=Cetobacterium somerae TaxID=188913 RepID=UPI002E7C03C8|nr:polysaccharide lyase 8 family protein [Cetobacterium somerae]WVJ00645.1 polysaccharide lyase 8 family protein [Cetobacterium somerae]
MKIKMILMLLLSACIVEANEKKISNENLNKEVVKSSSIVSQNEKVDFKKMRLKWAEFLTGKESLELQNPKIKKETIATLNNMGRKNLNNYNYDKARLSIYSDLTDMNSGVQVQTTYERLKDLSKVYVIPGTDFYRDEKIKNEILDSLEWLHKNAYYEGAPEYGNWWQWELGIPKNINEIVAIMYDEIPTENRMKYLKASQYFQPYAKYSGYSPSAKYSSSPELRVSTGGNRMDTSIISFARGFLMEDKEQVLDGVLAVGDVGEYVTSGDGFYKDSSFIQHGNIPYNGTYASVLFNGLGTMLYLTSGTQYEMTDERLNNIYDSIIDGYSFLLINGGVTDAVSGRSISRDGSNELERGRGLVTSIAMISEGAPKPYSKQIRKLVKKALEENTSYDTTEKIYNLNLKEIMKNIKNTETYEEQNESKSKIFWGMDRAVHQGNQGIKFVIGMHSSRIGNYETMNGENKKGWYTGDGVTYIYGENSDKSKEFWPTVDMYHLPGVTASINERRDGSGERRHKVKMSPKSFVGGVTTGKVTLAAMDFLSWNNQTSGKKSWFLIDNTMFAMGSNISSSDGEIHTTIDNRIVDGENFKYTMLSSGELVTKKEKRIGNWKNIGGKSEKPIEVEYITTYINHGKNPKNSSYLYSVGLDKVSKNDVEILSQNDKAHALKVKDYMGINFWQDSPYKVNKYKSFSTLSLLALEKGDTLELWVSDPTQLSNVMSVLEIDGAYKLAETTDKNLKIRTEKNKTILKIDNIRSGETKYIKLKK